MDSGTLVPDLGANRARRPRKPESPGVPGSLVTGYRSSGPLLIGLPTLRLIASFVDRCVELTTTHSA